MAKEFPVMGVGYWAFSEHYYYFYKVENNGSFLSSRKEIAHNSLIKLAATIGILFIFIFSFSDMVLIISIINV